jgi:hypothetical protein
MIPAEGGFPLRGRAPQPKQQYATEKQSGSREDNQQFEFRGKMPGTNFFFYDQPLT